MYMDSARKHLPKDNREAAKTFTIGKTLNLPVELSSQLPEGVDAITRNGKIYVSSTADDPAKGVFREYLARELHLPEGSSEILNPYLNDIPTIEKVWREAPELGLVIFQEIDNLRKQLKKQGSFFDDFLQPIQLMHYFYGQIEQEKRKYQKKA